MTHVYKAPGYYRVGVTVNNGRFSDLGYRDFRVVDDCSELGTEGQAADWAWTEVLQREGLNWNPKDENVRPLPPVQHVADPQSKVEIRDDPEVRLAGNSSIALRIEPSPAGNPFCLLYPKTKNAGISLAGKTRLVFWSRCSPAASTPGQA